MDIPMTVLWQVQLRHPFKRDLLIKAMAILDNNSIRPAPSGNFIVRSNTQVHVEYILDVANETCPCPAGKNGILCSHLLAYLLRKEMFEQAKAEAISSSNQVLALRESQMKESRRRSEWQEEGLDESYGEAMARGEFE